MDELNLKARAYDLIHLIETAKRELAQVNDEIKLLELNKKQEEKKDGE